MNNNQNLINQIGKNYGLTNEQFNLLITKYQNDQRDSQTITKELTNICDYYRYQNVLKKAVDIAPQLENGKNYYITVFDSSSNIYLQPVAITVTNSETSEVLVDNSLKCYQKHTAVDDLEISICQIGKALNFDVVEEYRVYNQNKQKDSVVIKDLVNEDEFYDIEDLNKRFSKLINAGKLKKEPWVDTSKSLSVANTKEDYKIAIDYGLKVLKSLPSILEEDYKKIEEKYFEMLVFDSIINQSERNFKDYGIICDKDTKRYSFAPLFDNVFPSILKNNDVFSYNGIICNRYELIECLLYNYYDKVKPKVEYILNNKNKVLNIVSTIGKYNLDINTYNMLMNNIITNINYFERVIKEKSLSEKNNNAGYVDALHMGIALLIIIIFSVVIAYLLYYIS